MVLSCINILLGVSDVDLYHVLLSKQEGYRVVSNKLPTLASSFSQINEVFVVGYLRKAINCI